MLRLQRQRRMLDVRVTTFSWWPEMRPVPAVKLKPRLRREHLEHSAAQRLEHASGKRRLRAAGSIEHEVVIVSAADA